MIFLKVCYIYFNLQIQWNLVFSDTVRSTRYNPGVQARSVDSVEGGSVMFWEVFFSAGGANTCAKGASL